MTWLSTIAGFRFWATFLEVMRAWSRSFSAIIEDFSEPELPVRGQYGRTFGRRSCQKNIPRRPMAEPAATTIRQTTPCQRDQVLRAGGYRSLMGLRQMLVDIDNDCTLKHPTVLLILAANFSGHLPGLIHRTSWGRRLVLVAENGCVPLPGKMTLANLAARESALGWGQIIFERDIEEAFSGALQSLDDAEPLVILWPEWLTDSLPQHIVDRKLCGLKPL